MCEIISRGRRLDNGEWEEGFFVHLHDGKGHESSRIYTGYAESDCGEFYPDWFDIDPETAGRDTGTTGAGGVKIFEGDIVRITLPITGAKPIVGGEHEKGYRALLRSGDGRPTAILFEKWTDGVGWTTIGHYQPKYCPNCGRELKENDHGPRKQATKIEARPWKPQDLLDDLQSIIDEEPDRYLNTRRTTLCTALAYLKEYFSETQPFPELTRGEIATEYLSICDEHDCTGDQSVGIQPCPFYKWPDVDDSGAPLPSGCKLKAILKEATK